MKSYTDLEQSKKLAEFLPMESADMYYNVVGDVIIEDYQSGISGARSVTKAFNKNPDEFAKNIIPCWSLAVLLDILPKQFGRYTKSLYWFDDAWHCEYMDEDSESKYGVSADNSLDACCEMIIKLKENNLI